MNSLTIIGNVTKDPELRTTPSGKTVCTFTVAANRRKKVDGQPEADFFRVSAWNALGENCGKYVQKGKKVCVIGSVSVHAYANSKGEPAANLEVLANEVEFLSPRQEQTQMETQIDTKSGMAIVNTDELPY